jgi:hypothetical protein
VANIYYSHPSNRRGFLRAVLSTDEGKSILKEHSARYAGEKFPTTGHDAGDEFVVLRLFDGEISDRWQVGFYIFDEGIIRIEEAVQSCTRDCGR